MVMALLMVMMAAALGSLAAQNANFELRSVGGLRQVTRLTRAGEAFAMSVGAYLSERARGGGLALNPADARWVSNDPAISLRDDYGLPAYIEDQSLFQVHLDEFVGNSYPLKASGMVPTDEALGGVANPFRFGGVALIERHKLPAQAGQGVGQANGVAVGQQPYRYCVTAFTRMFVPAEEPKQNEQRTRGLHESVALFRAYYDVR
jgi:hypothetical protein